MGRVLQEAPSLAAASVTFIDRRNRQPVHRRQHRRRHAATMDGSDIRSVRRTALLATNSAVSAARMAISGRSALTGTVIGDFRLYVTEYGL